VSEDKKSTGLPIWLVGGIVLALAAAVVGFASRSAKGNQKYDQLVGAIEELISEGRARAEAAAGVIGDTGEDLAKDLKKGVKKARRRLG